MKTPQLGSTVALLLNQCSPDTVGVFRYRALKPVLNLIQYVTFFLRKKKVSTRERIILIMRDCFIPRRDEGNAINHNNSQQNNLLYTVKSNWVGHFPYLRAFPKYT